MGRLEDELQKIARELEALDSARSAEGLERRIARAGEMVGALRSGGDLSGFDPREVNAVEEAMARYSQAAENVLSRLAGKEGRVDGEDGGWRPDEPR